MTKNINIYKVDENNFESIEGTAIEGKIATLINAVLAEKGFSKRIDSNEILKTEREEITYYNYVDNSIEKDSDWLEFLPQNLLGSFSFRDKLTTVLLFISNPPHLYVTIGGNGYNYIKKIIDHRFGLILLSKIVDDINDELISVNSRGMIGSMAAVQEQFRRSLKIIDYVKFGKIPLEVNVKLNLRTSTEFFSYLQNNRKTRIKVKAGRYFTVKKAIDYEQFHQLIWNLNFMMELEEQDSFSTFQRIDDRNEISQKFLPFLTRRLFESLNSVSGLSSESKNYDKFDFDICHHRLVQEFYEAESYLVEDKGNAGAYSLIASTDDRDNIYTIIRNRIIQLGFNLDIFKFRKYIYSIRITSVSEGVIRTRGSFLQHISAEIKPPGYKIPVFYLDSLWFKLNTTYKDQLNEDCWNLIVSNAIPAPHQLKPWNKEDIPREGDYNSSYSGLTNFMVFDTIVPSGVELCDLFKITDDSVYLYHVKGGFDAKMRDLCNQVVLSSRLLSDTLLTQSKEYLRKVHKQYVNKANPNPLYIDFNNFIKLFNGSRQIHIVMAIGISGDKTDNEVLIKKSNSSIAKFAVMNCNHQMKAFNFGFNICLI